MTTVFLIVTLSFQEKNTNRIITYTNSSNSDDRSFSVLNTFRTNYYAAIVDKIGRTPIYRGIAGNINIAAYSMVFKSIALLYFVNKTKNKIFKYSGTLLLIPTFFAISLTGSRVHFYQYI